MSSKFRDNLENFSPSDLLLKNPNKTIIFFKLNFILFYKQQ